MSRETVLLLIGNGGSGKSATANTLLGYNGFHKNNSTTRAVTETDVKKSPDQTLTIIDGLCLWGKDPKRLEEGTFVDAQRAVSKCGSGFNAILVVMKYGETYSEEDARVVDVTKKVFGQKIFEEFGVCVFTHGDDFKYAVEEGEEPCQTFPEWYNSRSGSLKQLVGDCGRRCVLFNNREKDTKEKNHLLQIVSHLSKNGTKRYTLTDFQKFHGRKFSASVSKTMTEKIFRDKLENIRKEFNGNGTDLQKMLNDLRDLSTEISQSQIDRKIIENLIVEAQKLTTSIKMQLDKHSAHVKEIPTFKPDMSDWVILDKDRVMSDVSNRSPLSKDSDSLRFHRDDFNQGTGDGVQDKAAQADRLINDFKSNTSFPNGAERERHYLSMKSQVLELLKSSPYLDNFKSKLSSLEQEIRNQLGLESSSIAEDIADDEITDTLPDKFETPDGVRLLLLGRSGNGKSSTGNSLLGKPAFQVSSSVAASRSAIAVESQRFEQFALSVVDGPSLDDTVLNTSTCLDEMLKSMREALQLCDYSFSGLLVILKFGQRFTKQEKNAVGLIKSILGKDVLRKYGVCVMTHGDNYDYEMEEEKINFLEWCQTQTGEIAELFEECSYRCVLIDNKTQDEQKQMKQRNKVLDLVKRSEKYSEEEFVDAEKDFQDLSIQCAMPQLEQANSVIMSKLREKLQQLEQQFPNGEGTYRAELESMQQALQEYIHNIESLGNNATIEYLVQLASTLQMQINSKLRLCQQTEELRRLEKEKERIQENISSPLTPIGMRQDEWPAYHHVLPDRPSPEAVWTVEADRRNSFEMRKHQKELNDFVQDTQLRWGQANSSEPTLRMHYKKVIVKDIELRLKEAASRGEKMEATDRACAELIQMKERIEHEIHRETCPQPSYSYDQTYPKESRHDMGYYHQETGRKTNSMHPYGQARHTSSTGYKQQPKKFQSHQSKVPKGVKIKKYILKRWSEMESFLKDLFKTSNNLYV